MSSYLSPLFSILFLRDLNLLVPELTSILIRDSERCETFSCSGGTKLSFGGDPLGQCQCIGVWERDMYWCLGESYVLVFGTELCIGVWERVMYWCLGESCVLVFGRKLCIGVWERVMYWCLGESYVLVFGRELCTGVWEKVMYWCLGESYVLVFGTELCIGVWERVMYVFFRCLETMQNSLCVFTV